MTYTIYRLHFISKTKKELVRSCSLTWLISGSGLYLLFVKHWETGSAITSTVDSGGSILDGNILSQGTSSYALDNNKKGGKNSPI